MTSPQKTARIAGLLYLFIIFLGFFYLRYVPVTLIVRSDPAETLNRITGHEILFKLGILAEMIADLIFLLMALVLYRLFSSVDRNLGVLMVVFVTLGIVVSYIGIQHKLDVISLIKQSGNNAFSSRQLQQQVMLNLDYYRYTIISGEFFWGLWLLPLGLLIIRSRYIPYFLGILLLLGCMGYVIDFAFSLLFPDTAKMPLLDYITMPASIGELGTCLWLLIAGARVKANRNIQE